ncbi:MAG: polyketide cyclase [Bdellovibrionaceae bacterium]|nr:polyketide cyclase [Pseudobdellovibrionaceae bacterium]
MAFVKKEENFKCTAKQLFDILSDYESYPDFLADVKGISILKSTKTYKIIEYTVAIIKNVTYQLRVKEKKNKEITWTLESGLLFKSLEGSWVLKESKTKKGTTDVIYEVEMKLKFFAPKLIEKTLVEVNLKTMMKSFKKRVKQLYG